MNTSSRFAIAVHALTAMALCEDEWVASKSLAESINSNASFIRRVLGNLRRVGLIDSQPGPCGGLSLARPPDRITLLEIYEAVEEEALFALHNRPPNPECPVGAQIVPTLERFFERAECAMKRELEGVTLGQIMASVAQQEPSRPRCLTIPTPATPLELPLPGACAGTTRCGERAAGEDG